MSTPGGPRIPLPPWARRAVAAAVLVAGVVLVGRLLQEELPREVEVRLPLRGFDEGAPGPVVVELSFLRGDEVVRSLRRRYEGGAPRELVETVSLPAGEYVTRVSVEVGTRVLESESTARVVPGETLVLRPPAPP